MKKVHYVQSGIITDKGTPRRIMITTSMPFQPTQVLCVWFATLVYLGLSAKLPQVNKDPQLRDLSINELNFLHTTDTHGWYSGHLNQRTYSGDWGDFISFSQHLKNIVNSKGGDLLLVDSGDRHDGNGLSDITTPNGNRSLPIFVKQKYDIVTLGNHELYVAENWFLEKDYVVPHYGENYVNTNVDILVNGSWQALGNKFRYFETPVRKNRVLALSFLFDFKRNNNFTRITPISKVIREEWFQDILNNHSSDKVDTVVVVGHVPVDREWNELSLLHAELRTHYPDTKIEYFGGHSHIRDFVIYDEKLVALQSGRFCETVGFLSVNVSSDSEDTRELFSRTYIDFNQQLFLHHSKKKDLASFVTQEGDEVKSLIHKARQDLKLDSVIGHVTELNYFVDYVPLSHPKNLFRLLTSRVLPSLQPDSDTARSSDERLIIINTGSVRYDLYKGPFTTDTHFIISPFQNDWSKITVPKNIATQIAPRLNENDYILAKDGSKNERYLLPPHQQTMQRKGLLRKRNQDPIIYGSDEDFVEEPPIEADKSRLSKGYVTRDEFGTDGDDTPHRAVINYPIPNVVQSRELKKLSHHAPVDVVFYNFITPNILEVLEQLDYPAPRVEHYSKKYLGLLLDEFVAGHKL